MPKKYSRANNRRARELKRVLDPVELKSGHALVDDYRPYRPEESLGEVREMDYNEED